MALNPSDFTRRLRLPGYVIAVVVIIVPLVEIPLAALPARVHEPPWRLGVINAVVGSATLPLLALFLCFVVAALSGDRFVAWSVCAVCALSAAVLLIGAGDFALDALQMKRQVRAEATSRYLIASGWAVFKIFLSAVAFMILALRSGRSAAALRPEVRRGAGKRGLLVANPAASPAANPLSVQNNVPLRESADPRSVLD